MLSTMILDFFFDCQNMAALRLHAASSREPHMPVARIDRARLPLINRRHSIREKCVVLTVRFTVVRSAYGLIDDASAVACVAFLSRLYCCPPFGTTNAVEMHANRSK